MAINLNRLKTVAERYMRDTLTITRPEDDASMVLDPVTMALTIDSAAIYTGKGMVAVMGTSSPQTLGEGVPVARLMVEVSIPAASPAINPNDIITVTASEDPRLVGKTIRVVAEIPATYSVMRRLSAILDQDSQ
jgi:hypothetical protein